MIQHFIPSDFKISKKIDTTYAMSDFHLHDQFEIYFTLTDGVNLFVNDRVYTLVKGDLVLFTSLDLHKVITPSDCTYVRYTIEFSPSYIDHLSTSEINLLRCFSKSEYPFNTPIHLDTTQQNEFINLIEKASSIIHDSPYNNDIYQRLLLGEMLIYVNHYYKSNTQLTYFKYNDDYLQVKPILDYIHQHLNTCLNRTLLSNLFHMNPNTLCHLFKHVTGFTLNNYIIHKRILKSKELLKLKVPVTEVCEQVGFNNYSHFIRTFTKLVGISPKQYALQNESTHY